MDPSIREDDEIGLNSSLLIEIVGCMFRNIITKAQSKQDRE